MRVEWVLIINIAACGKCFTFRKCKKCLWDDEFALMMMRMMPPWWKITAKYYYWKYDTLHDGVDACEMSILRLITLFDLHHIWPLFLFFKWCIPDSAQIILRIFRRRQKSVNRIFQLRKKIKMDQESELKSQQTNNDELLKNVSYCLQLKVQWISKRLSD